MTTTQLIVLAAIAIAVLAVAVAVAVPVVLANHPYLCGCPGP